MAQFSEKTVKGFQHLVMSACQRKPDITLVELVIKWRGCKTLNQTSLDVIHYGSHIIESRPGIGQMPILSLFFNI